MSKGIQSFQFIFTGQQYKHIAGHGIQNQT